MTPTEAHSRDDFPLTEEYRMLLHIRDTLYEGSWEDFTRDLRARAEDRPHVFETVPTSPAMKATIKNHLAMIDEMQAWECRRQRALSTNNATGHDSLSHRRTR